MKCHGSWGAVSNSTSKPSSEQIRLLLASLLVDVGGMAIAAIDDRATLDNELQMESVAFVELQVALEDELGIEIDPVQVVELNEFGAIVQYIHGLVLNRVA
ncbi:MAG: acyl carrier protein [Candidatus Binatia bacterium]